MSVTVVNTTPTITIQTGAAGGVTEIFHAKASGDIVVASGSVPLKLIYDTQTISNTNYSVSTGRFTAPSVGNYVFGTLFEHSSSEVALLSIIVIKNLTSGISASAEVEQGSSAQKTLSFWTPPTPLIIGDFIDVTAIWAGSSSLTLKSGAGGLAFFGYKI